MEVTQGPISDERVAAAQQVHTLDRCSAVGDDMTGPVGQGPREQRVVTWWALLSQDASTGEPHGGEQTGGLGLGEGTGSDR